MTSNFKYFLAIEDDLINCSKYVEFDVKNFSTYSIEFAKIIMTSSSEIDSIFKQLCKLILPSANPQKISEYYPIILKKYPKFTEIEIEFSRYDIIFKPWEEWDNNTRPKWWTSYNKIKHERDLNFEMANLKNTIYSVGALFSLLLYLGVEKSDSHEEFMLHEYITPKTFETIDKRNPTGRNGTYTSYYLPDF